MISALLEVKRRPAISVLVALAGVATSLMLHLRSIVPSYAAELLWIAACGPCLLYARGLSKDALSVILSLLGIISAVLLSIVYNDSSPLRLSQIILCVLVFSVTMIIVERFGRDFLVPFLVVSSALFVAYAILYFGYMFGILEKNYVSYVRGANIRMEGLLDGPNYFGMTAFGTLVVALAFHLKAKGSRLYEGAALSGVVFSLSRAVLISGLVIAIVKGLLNPLKALTIVLPLLVLAVAALSVLIMLDTSALQPLYNRFFDQGGGAQDRLEVTLGAIRATATSMHLLFGYGLWPYEQFGYSEPAHNGYATILVEHGVIGLTSLLSFFVVVSVSIARHSKHRERIYFFLYLFSLALALALNDFHIYRDWWVSLGAVVGTVLSRGDRLAGRRP